MSNNMHNFKKIFRKINERRIKFIGKFNHTRYMRLYLKYLKKYGMIIDGTPIYISPTVRIDGTDFSLISIGDRCVISSDVLLLTHDYSLSRGMEAIGENVKKEVYMLGKITIGKNCFVGARSMLLPGTTLGNNVIVGAGSVVKGNIPDDSIIIGNPAKIVGNTMEWAKKKRESAYYENEFETKI